jgi:hypothetical protein
MNEADLCATLLRRVSPEADIIAVVRAGSRLAYLLQQVVSEARLFCLFAETADGILPEQALGEWWLAASAQNVDTPASAALPWPHPTHPARRRRRLDTLFPRHRDVGLIVTQDPTGAADLLYGARGIIAATAPPVVIDLSTLPLSQRRGVWLAAAEMLSEYLWYNSMLQPRRVDATVLSDPVIMALKRGEAQVHPVGASGRSKLNGTTREAVKKVVTVFDASLCCRGFFPVESNAEWVGRWTGNGSVCAFALLLPGPGTWHLSLDIADWGVVTQPEMLGVTVGKAALGIQHVSGRRIRFGDIMVPPIADDGRLVVKLSTPRPRKRHRDDAHAVGVAFVRATLEQVSS